MLAETEEAIATAYGLTTADIFVNGSSAPIADAQNVHRRRLQKIDQTTELNTSTESRANITRVKIFPSQEVNISHNVKVVGFVEAGAWREMRSVETVEEVLPYYDQEFKGIELFGLRVRGNSCNLVYPEGTTVIVARRKDVMLRNGDFVVIKRTDGNLAETTVKQLEVKQGKWLFWPRSSEPEHQEPFARPPRNEFAQDGWEILGIVVGESRKARRMGEIVQEPA